MTFHEDCLMKASGGIWIDILQMVTHLTIDLVYIFNFNVIFSVISTKKQS